MDVVSGAEMPASGRCWLRKGRECDALPSQHLDEYPESTKE